MNSWHSWSPNGRWLVFSSKANSPYTQLWLSYIDVEGNSSPPVSLSHLTEPDRAANIPEFVQLSPSGIRKIREQFLNDYSYERTGNQLYKAGEADHAIVQFRKALEINPNNLNAHQRLGFLLSYVKHQFKEGMAHSLAALRLEPENVLAHCDLGLAFLSQDQPDEAIRHFTEALRLKNVSPEPQYQSPQVRFYLAQAFLMKGQFSEVAAQLTEVVRARPNDADAHYLLAMALASQGLIEEPLKHYSKAIALRPGVDTLANLHERLALNYARAGQFDNAIVFAGKAVQLARAQGNGNLASQIEAQIRYYQQGRTP
jgi:tetratricopeptide (TPR) repeat protein